MMQKHELLAGNRNQGIGDAFNVCELNEYVRLVQFIDNSTDLAFGEMG